MALTKPEITNVLAFIEDEIHAVNRIDIELSQAQNSSVLDVKAGFDESTTKKDHLVNIVKAIRFMVEAAGVTQIPIAFTHQELIDKGVLEQ